MITGRKLTTEEVAALETKKNRQAGNVRAAKLAEYDALVKDFETGEYGEVELDIGDKKLTVRKHITKAFSRRGLGVNWRRSRGNTLRFQAVEIVPAAPVVVEPVVKPKRSRKSK